MGRGLNGPRVRTSSDVLSAKDKNGKGTLKLGKSFVPKQLALQNYRYKL